MNQNCLKYFILFRIHGLLELQMDNQIFENLMSLILLPLLLKENIGEYEQQTKTVQPEARNETRSYYETIVSFTVSNTVKGTNEPNVWSIGMATHLLMQSQSSFITS